MWWTLALAWAAPGLDIPRGVQLAEQVYLGSTATVSRMEQTLHGLPVHGRQLVVIAPTAGPTRTVGSIVEPVPLTTPRWTAAQAIAVTNHLVGHDSALFDARAELVWFARGTPRLAWAVDTSTNAPMTMRIWIDAQTGVHLDSEITSSAAVGSSYETDPDDGEPVEVELEHLLTDDTLSGAYVSAQSCSQYTEGPPLRCNELTRQATPDADGNYLYEPDPLGTPDPFAEVNVYVHTDRVAAWLDEHLGFTLFEPIDAIVNVDVPNAYFGDFDGDRNRDIWFGHIEENGRDLAYDHSLIYHEYGHAVNYTLWGGPASGVPDELGMNWTPGAFNEGMSDIWSMLVSGDRKIAEYGVTGLAVSTGVRDHDADRRCPDDLVGEEHLDGRVLASFGWNVITDPDIGQELAADLFYAVTPRVPLLPQWPDIAAVITEAADELASAGSLSAEGRSAIDRHLLASNMAKCERIRVIADAEPFTVYLLSGRTAPLAADPTSPDVSTGTQWSVELPEDVTGVRVVVHDWVEDQDAGWTIFGRYDQPIVHTDKTIGARRVASPDRYRMRVEGDGVGSIEIPPEQLQPGATLFLQMAGRAHDTVEAGTILRSRAEVSVEVETAAPEEEPADGCGCQGTGSTPGWLVLLAVAGMRRRQT